jgi:hypothetical protein
MLAARKLGSPAEAVIPIAFIGTAQSGSTTNNYSISSPSINAGTDHILVICHLTNPTSGIVAACSLGGASCTTSPTEYNANRNAVLTAIVSGSGLSGVETFNLLMNNSASGLYCEFYELNGFSITRSELQSTTASSDTVTLANADTNADDACFFAYNSDGFFGVTNPAVYSMPNVDETVDDTEIDFGGSQFQFACASGVATGTSTTNTFTARINSSSQTNVIGYYIAFPPAP